MTKTLSEHISSIINELNNGDVSAQRKRHLANELNDLETYKKNHPNEEYNPTSLELYCELNPEAPECRVYED